MRVMLCRKGMLNTEAGQEKLLQYRALRQSGWQCESWQVTIPNDRGLAAPWLLTLLIDSPAAVVVKEVHVKDEAGHSLLRSDDFQPGKVYAP